MLTNSISIYRKPHQTSEYGTRSSFKLVQVQGRSPDTPGKHKNASGPIGIPLKWGASGAKR